MSANSYRRTLLALAQGGFMTAAQVAHQLGEKRILADYGVEDAAVDLNAYDIARDRSSSKPPRSARPRRSLRRGGD